ncbi:hypothetical protein C8Q75DRAFT_732750 [Abortiporus biennis]|nr:hypothetical protein C8Q75DRAFT_732750 [Abortiporus biennis]
MPTQEYPATLITSNVELIDHFGIPSFNAKLSGANLVTAVSITVSSKTFITIGGTAFSSYPQKITAIQSDKKKKTVNSGEMTGSATTGDIFTTDKGEHAMTLNPVNGDTTILLSFLCKPDSNAADWSYSKGLDLDFTNHCLNVKGISTVYMVSPYPTVFLIVDR